LKSGRPIESKSHWASAAVPHVVPLKPLIGETLGVKIYLYVMHVGFDMPSLRKDVLYVIMFRGKKIKMVDVVHNVEEVGCELFTVSCVVNYVRSLLQ
jgi:hypothetical protein